MQKLALDTLDLAVQRGASYADVRAVERRTEDLLVKNGQPERSTLEESAGLGVRVLVDGAWGFAASSDLSGEALATTVERALDGGPGRRPRSRPSPCSCCLGRARSASMPRRSSAIRLPCRSRRGWRC